MFSLPLKKTICIHMFATCLLSLKNRCNFYKGEVISFRKKHNVLHAPPGGSTHHVPRKWLHPFRSASGISVRMVGSGGCSVGGWCVVNLAQPRYLSFKKP